MANEIRKENYAAMINALNTFAGSVTTSASEMQSLASVCASALSGEDKAAGEIYKKIRDCQLKYAEAAQQARAIAASMQEELDRAQEEDNVWAED